MKIPNDELHYSHIAAYGSGGVELTAGVKEPGCPDLFHARYVARKRIAQVPRWQLTYGQVVHQALYLVEEEAISQDEALERAWDASLSLERWQEAQTDLRRVIERGGIAGGLHTVAVEQHLSTDLADGYRYGGTLDVVAVDDEMEVAVPTLYFTDWKTDRGTPSRRDVEEWKQGWGYAMLLYDNFRKYMPWADDVKIVGIYDAIKRYAIPVEYSREQIESFRAWALAIYKIIEADKEHEPKLNPMCSWCPIRPDCVRWKELPGNAEALVNRAVKRSLKRRAEELPEIKETKSRLDLIVKETEEGIRQEIDAAGEAFAVKGGTWMLNPGEQREVDWLEVSRIMGDEFVKHAKMTLADLDAWIEEHPDKNLDHAIRRIPSKPRLKFEADE